MSEPLWKRTIKQWPAEWREEWEERAAIMEVDGHRSRADAERAAFDAVAKRKLEREGKR